MGRKISKPQVIKMNFWAMIHGVLINAMVNGQLPVTLLGLIILTCVFRMPSSEIASFIHSILDKLIKGYILGYALFIGVTCSYYIHVKKQRSMMNRELDRISKERNELQKKLVGDHDIKSSEG